ncbi:hypothetical protein ABG768_019407, partial [Culter alburnus]
AIYISRPETAERWNQNSQHPSVQEAHLDLTQWLHCAACLLSVPLSLSGAAGDFLFPCL